MNNVACLCAVADNQDSGVMLPGMTFTVGESRFC